MYSGTRGRLLGHRFRSMPNGKSVGGQIPQPSKTISRFGGLRDDLPWSSRPPDEHVFGVGRFFRTIADEDGQISLPADLETIAEKLGLQTEMR